jgi:hypothetical protein
MHGDPLDGFDPSVDPSAAAALLGCYSPVPSSGHFKI